MVEDTRVRSRIISIMVWEDLRSPPRVHVDALCVFSGCTVSNVQMECIVTRLLSVFRIQMFGLMHCMLGRIDET